MKTRDYKPELRAILAAYEKTGGKRAHAQKHLMMAFGVDAAMFGQWRDASKEDGPWFPNAETRDAIESLLDPQRDHREGGIASSVAEMRATVEDLEGVLRVRRALREALATRPAEEDEVVRRTQERATAPEALRGKGRQKRRRGGGGDE